MIVEIVVVDVGVEWKLMFYYNCYRISNCLCYSYKTRATFPANDYDFLAKKICFLLGQMRPQKSSTKEYYDKFLESYRSLPFFAVHYWVVLLP
jgi:hypothetical protein